VSATQLIFPLKPTTRLSGLAYGTMRSTRRGTGSDVASSRAYRPGDDVKAIDWRASAKLSLARGAAEFVVREHFADQAPRVVVLCDRSPSMSLFPQGWPWLSKPAASRSALQLIDNSARAAQGYVGYLDHADGAALWRPPKSQHTLEELDLDRPFGAPDDALALGLEELLRHRSDLPLGTFVFVVSDFLPSPPRELWLRVVARRWKVVPVVIQDRVWEQSFPDVGGIVMPFAHPRTGEPLDAELSDEEARERREQNERRRAELVRSLRALELDPVLLDREDVRSALSAFLAWADRQLTARGRTW
jgi:uncharacterized protein (DUF58 family)